MVHVIAIITAQPGQRGPLLQAFQANLAAVHAEDGCIEYAATVDATGAPHSPGTVGADTFVVVEKWRDLAALQAHAVAPHMQAFAAHTKHLTAGVLLHVLEPVA